jgi:hypothetical protein
MLVILKQALGCFLQRVTVTVAACLLLAGCIDVEKVVRVEPDGSGVVEETVVMKKEMIEMMRQMEAAVGTEGAEETQPMPLMLDRDKLQEQAKGMGDAVTLVSAEPVVTDFGEGYRATFQFDDINRVQLNQNPGDQAPAGDGGQNVPAAGQRREPVRFQFEKGPEPVLTVYMPEQEQQQDMEKDRPAREDVGQQVQPVTESDAQAMMLVRQMLDGLRVAIRVEVAGPIRETNATFMDGSRVTLMEIEFDRLLEDPERFQVFTSENPQSLEQAKHLLKDIPGIKVELEPEIRIRFAAGEASSISATGKAETLDAASLGELAAAYRWWRLPPKDLHRHVSDIVRVTRTDGSVEKGRLDQVSDDELRITRASLDGGGMLRISRRDVRETAIFAKAPPQQ